MWLKRDIEAGSEIARQMIDDNNRGAIYTAGVKAVGEEYTPSMLRWGCLPVVAGAMLGICQEISVGAFEHIIPTMTAALILLGFGGLLKKIRQ